MFPHPHHGFELLERCTSKHINILYSFSISPMYKNLLYFWHRWIFANNQPFNINISMHINSRVFWHAAPKTWIDTSKLGVFEIDRYRKIAISKTVQNCAHIKNTVTDLGNHRCDKFLFDIVFSLEYEKYNLIIKRSYHTVP